VVDYFDEKIQQVEFKDGMKSFGIEIESRYEKAWEIAEMLNFTTNVAMHELHSYVESVYYDSKANICSFKLSSNLEQYSEAAEKIKLCARNTISQFEMFGYIDHGLEYKKEMGL